MSTVSTPEVVVRTREALLRCAALHEWPDATVRERAISDMLALVATVPYGGDDSAYMHEAWDRALAFMNPIVTQLRKDAELLRMPVPKSIH